MVIDFFLRQCIPPPDPRQICILFSENNNPLPVTGMDGRFFPNRDMP